MIGSLMRLIDNGSTSELNSMCTCKLYICTLFFCSFMYKYRYICTLLFLFLSSLLKKMVKNHFKDDFGTVFKHLSSTGGMATDDDMRSLLFGDYMKLDAVRREEGEGGRRERKDEDIILITVLMYM